jgi:hypothetical protein
MEFKVSFNCDNDAFAVFPEEETAKILKGLAHAVKQGLTYGPIYDSNGNGIGKWEFSFDGEK